MAEKITITNTIYPSSWSSVLREHLAWRLGRCLCVKVGRSILCLKL